MGSTCADALTLKGFILPIETQTPGSAGWWFKQLVERMQDRYPSYVENRNYFEGSPPAAIGPPESRKVYQDFLKISKTNWADLVVEATRERLRVVGFNTNSEDERFGDDAAWTVWQANQLDAETPLMFEEMLALGDSYMIVGPPRQGVPTITVESPLNVITADDTLRRADARAALKVWTDDWTGESRAVLYLPGFALYLERKSNVYETSQMATTEAWEWTGQVDQIPGRMVPVTRFRNRPTTQTGPGRSEFEHVKPDINRINTMILQRVSVAIFQAFRQRAVKGVPTDGSDGDFDWDNALRADPGALWRLPEGVEMWESGGVDLTPILESVKADVRDLAARTRTPMFYLFPDAANGSAEGASLQREGLVFKAGARIQQASDPMEQVMHHAFVWLGDEHRNGMSQIESVWSPPERFTLAERYDAASKAQAAGVPWETVMSEVLQFSPQQIATMRTQRSTDQLLLPEAV